MLGRGNYAVVMMTSSNGNIFRVTGHLCGEFTGLRWIPHTKDSEAEFWCFSLICTWTNGWVNNGEAGDLRRHRAHYNVSVMVTCCADRVYIDFVQTALLLVGPNPILNYLCTNGLSAWSRIVRLKSTDYLMIVICTLIIPVISEWINV